MGELFVDVISTPSMRLLSLSPNLSGWDTVTWDSLYGRCEMLQCVQHGSRAVTTGAWRLGRDREYQTQPAQRPLIYICKSYQGTATCSIDPTMYYKTQLISCHIPDSPQPKEEGGAEAPRRCLRH